MVVVVLVIVVVVVLVVVGAVNLTRGVKCFAIVCYRLAGRDDYLVCVGQDANKERRTN